MAYARRQDIELIFGAVNVDKWADLDGDNHAGKIQARVDWALEQATADINDTLDGGPYTLPFADAPNAPTSIKDVTARQAGVLLYDSRGLRDADESKDSLQPHRKRVSEYLRAVRAGTKRVYGGTIAVSTIPEAGD